MRVVRWRHRRWEKEKRRRRLLRKRNKKKKKKEKEQEAAAASAAAGAGDDTPLADDFPSSCDLGGWEMIYRAPFTVNRPISCLNADFVVRGTPLVPPKRTGYVHTLNLLG